MKTARKSLSAEIAERILQFIFDEGLTPGDKLPSETELMESYGVSRSTVREALKRIEAHGILDIRPRRGAEIARCDVQSAIDRTSWAFRVNPEMANLRDLAESRYVTEMSAIPFIIDRATGMDIDDIEEIAERLSETSTIADRRKIDVEFHQRLLSCTANPILASLTDMTRIWFDALAKSSPNRVFPDTGQEPQFFDHHNIVLAMRERNKAKMIEQMELHFASYKSYFALNLSLYET